jgi:hypothetical protein
VIRQSGERDEGPEGSAIEAAVTAEPAINSTQNSRRQCRRNCAMPIIY